MLVREAMSTIKQIALKKNQVISHDSPAMEAEMKLMTNTLETIARHIESQTDLVKDMTMEIRSMRSEHERFRTDFRRELDQISEEMRRPRSS